MCIESSASIKIRYFEKSVLRDFVTSLVYGSEVRIKILTVRRTSDPETGLVSDFRQVQGPAILKH